MANYIKYICKVCGIEYYDYISNHRIVCSRKCAYLIQEKNHKHICNECNEIFVTKRKNSKFCSPSCSGKNATRLIRNRSGGASGERHWNWKGGRSYAGLYKTIRINGKSIYEHRYTVEQYLGRKLHTKEQVHHINNKHRDNRIDNLIVVTPAWHTRLHQLLRRQDGNIA